MTSASEFELRVACRARRAKQRSGAALVDTLIAAAVLTVGVLNAVLATIKSSELQEATRAYIQAHNTSRDVLEQLRSGDLDAQFQAFSANADFPINDQQVAVRFPVAMLEDLYGGAVPGTAKYRDLDGDGEVDLDVASAEETGLLPVRITVSEGSLRFRLDDMLSEL